MINTNTINNKIFSVDIIPPNQKKIDSKKNNNCTTDKNIEGRIVSLKDKTFLQLTANKISKKHKTFKNDKPVSKLIPLPKDICSLIFQFLSVKEAINLRPVSKSFRDLANRKLIYCVNNKMPISSKGCSFLKKIHPQELDNKKLYESFAILPKIFNVFFIGAPWYEMREVIKIAPQLKFLKILPDNKIDSLESHIVDLFERYACEELEHLDISKSYFTSPSIFNVKLNFKNLKTLNLNQTLLDNDRLSLIIEKLPQRLHLEELYLDCNWLTEVKNLKEAFPNLKVLSLNHNPFKFNEFLKIIDMPNLETLNCSNTPLTPTNAISEYKKIDCYIKTLSLANSEIGNGLKQIRLWKLIKINLNNCNLSDECLDSLVDTSNLKDLSLDSNNITDAGLKKISEWVGELERFAIARNQITNQSVPPLISAHIFKKLKSLDISENRISTSQIQTIKQTIPLEEFHYHNQLEPAMTQSRVEI